MKSDLVTSSFEIVYTSEGSAWCTNERMLSSDSDRVSVDAPRKKLTIQKANDCRSDISCIHTWTYVDTMFRVSVFSNLSGVV